MILTGGYYSMEKVQQYNLTGSMGTDLPDLKTGRYDHGCGSYLHSGEVVSTITIDNAHNNIYSIHRYLLSSLVQFQYLC